MKIFLLLFLNLSFSLIVLGQDFQPIDRSKMPNTQPETYRGEIYRRKPKLSLQDAMKVMEQYIEKQKIDTSKYFLWNVNLIQYGSQNDKRPVWYFWWLSEKGGVGDYIEILVSMDKKAGRVPSM